MITNFKIFKRYKYKYELSILRVKLDFLTEEALSGRATKSDIKFWDEYLDNLLKIDRECNFKKTKQMYDYYNNIYMNYVKVKEV